ncbi:MAG: hypothetical protein R3206_10590, partial [Salegentibacter mishustinae]|nr:hypothetical protein [Salegentibacter mishustinae]
IAMGALKGATSGGVTGFATAPQGQREMSGTVGAGLGGALPAAGGALKESMRSFSLPLAAHKFLQKFSTDYEFPNDEDINKEMVNDIGNRIVEQQNKTAPQYEAILKDKNLPELSKESDLSNYKDFLDELPEAERGYFKEPTKLINRKRGTADIDYLHRYQSQLRNLGATNKVSPATAAEGRQALREDMRNFLEKHGKGTEYEDVTQQYKQNMSPYFREIKSSSGKKIPTDIRKLRDYLNTTTDPETGLKKVVSENPLLGTKTVEEVTAPLIEKPGTTGTKKLNYLTDLLGGDRASAIKYTKYNLFKKAIDSNKQEIDPKKFISIFKTLSGAQKRALFTPMDEDMINNIGKSLGETKDLRSPSSVKWLRHIANMLMGGLTAAHTPGGVGGDVLGFSAGYGALPLASKIGRTTVKATLPNDLEGLNKIISGTKEVSPIPRNTNPFAVGSGVNIAQGMTNND